MASTKPKSSPKKPTPASSKKGSAKEAKAAPKAAKAPRGEDLVASVLASKGIALKTADAESPSFPTPTLFLEAERVIAAYRKARAAFVKVPTFEQDLADAGRGLLEHAMVVDSTWQKARFAKKKGESRGALRKEGEALRAKVLKSARFFFRNDPKVLLEVDRIAEGDDLPDLIRDLDDVAALATEHASLFAAAPRLGDVPKLARALATSLREATDPLPTAELLAARNRAVVALGLALREIRAAARFLYEDSPKAFAPYVSTQAVARGRTSRAKNAKKRTADATE